MPPLFSKKPSQKFLTSSLTRRAILKLISQNLIAKDIAKKLNKSKQNISYHLKQLELRGFIKSEIVSNIKTYSLTKASQKILRGCEEGYNISDRSHNIKLKAKIIDSPKKFPDDWRLTKLRNWNKYSKFYGDILIERTPSNLIFQLPIIFYENSDTAMLEAGRIVTKLIEYLQENIRGLRLGTPELVDLSICSQHHSIPNDPFAQFLIKNSINYKDDKINVDASKGFPELEFVDPITSQDDWSNYVDFVKDQIKTPTKFSDVKNSMFEYFERLDNSLNKFAVGMEQHMALISELRVTANSMNKTIGREHFRDRSGTRRKKIDDGKNKDIRCFVK